MHCREIVDLIDPYVDGTLADETRSRVERHLMRCGECSFEVRTLEQARAHLREAMPPAESSPSFREKMIARLTDEFGDVLRPVNAPHGSQWALPFPCENAG